MNKCIFNAYLYVFGFKIYVISTMIFLQVVPPEDLHDESIPESIKYRIPKDEFQNIKTNLSQV